MKRKNDSNNTQGRMHRITAFYIETLVLTVVFIAVILVLMWVFALSGRMSTRAKLLTNAVHLAENAAEAVAASDSEDKLFALLDEAGRGNVTGPEEGEGSFFRVRYDGEMNPAADGSFRVDVTWEPQEGDLVKSGITVYWNEEVIYTLDTAVYAGR